MGEGMRRIAEQYGGMRVSMRGQTCDYVAVKGASEDQSEMWRRYKDGWQYIGTTEDGKFLRFTKPTAELDHD